MGKLILLLAVLSGLVQTAPGQTPSPPIPKPSLCLRAPEGIEPNKINLAYVAYRADGGTIGRIRCSTMRYWGRNYYIPTKGASSVRLVASCTGYGVVAERIDLKNQPAATPFELSFQPIQMLPLPLRFLDTKGNPVAGQPFKLSYELFEETHFLGGPPRFSRYSGYSGRGPTHLEVAEGVSGEDGRADIRVPAMLEDPFIVNNEAMPKRKREFVLHLPEDVVAGPGPDPVPSRISVQSSYSPTIVTLIRRATLVGTVDRQFLQAHGLSMPGSRAESGHATSPSLFVGLAQSYSLLGVSVRRDGAFSISASPGTYNLFLDLPRRRGAGDERMYLVQEGLVLKEGEERTINIREGKPIKSGQQFR